MNPGAATTHPIPDPSSIGATADVPVMPDASNVSNVSDVWRRRSPMTWVPTLYLAEGLPFYAVALIASLMYKSLGVPNDQIARWTGLLGWPGFSSRSGARCSKPPRARSGWSCCSSGAAPPAWG